MREGILTVGKRPLLGGDKPVLQDRDDQVPTQEHLGEAAVLVDRLGLFALAAFGDLSPHLFHILQHHVAVPVSKYSHILRYWELGLKYINLEDTIQPISGRRSYHNMKLLINCLKIISDLNISPGLTLDCSIDIFV